MRVNAAGFIRRRILAGLVDFTIEGGAGLLGAYFGALIGALLTTLREDTTGMMQDSIRSGLGQGFLFWYLSFSFMNRVVYQGISRASIGKHIFRIELYNYSRPVTWRLMTQRWLLSLASVVGMGAGYWFALFSRAQVPFRDHWFGFGLIREGDVAPVAENSNVISFPQKVAPTRGPISEATAAQLQNGKAAEVIELHSTQDHDKKERKAA